MSNSPLVSVIIPAYNAAQFLKTTLASVRAQTYRNIEIIVIDDGSTDSTGVISEEAAKEDDRIRIIRQPNLGVAAARNRGLAEAKGEFIAPLDADDLWHPQNLTLQVAQLRNAGSDVAVSYAWFVDINAQGMFIGYGPRNILRHKQEVSAAELEGNFIGNASSTVMRRKAVEAAGGYDVTLRARQAEGCEDQALYFALAQKWNYTFVPQYLIAYRRHAGAMSQNQQMMVLSHAFFLSDLQKLRPPVTGLYFHRAIARIHEGLLSNALLHKQWRKIAEIIKQCRSISGWSVVQLLGIRLPVRIVGFCMHRLQDRAAAPETAPRAYDVFTHWSSEHERMALSTFERDAGSLAPSRGPI
jgi:glycosyltransferase involved in cell wall biosynthesis